ncbi:MAG: membrane-bound lytic murein transglycosylase MltF, partial [Pseudomonadota bacterium]
FAAAGLTVTEAREREVRFTDAYQSITQHLVYRLGNGRPRAPQDVVDGELVVLGGSSHADTLADLKATLPALQWQTDHDAGADFLIYQVHTGDIDYTIADSNEFAISRQHYPTVRSAFELKAGDALAWAFPRDGDDSLYDAAQTYLSSLEESGELARLLERYYGHTDRFDYVGTRRFLRHIQSRLPRYRAWFEEAGEQVGMDWRLLAAVGYQESHWNPAAVSPTGVRGIMMLTQATARQLGIPDRTDPRASILGGARYVRRVRGKIPERIREPDRTWLALAAYNVGFGHLEDARILAEINGLDPDQWPDVRTQLPLLTKRKWHSRVRYGYARGWEPVHYVDNIRRYYDILSWALSDRNRTQTVEPEQPAAPLPREGIEVEPPAPAATELKTTAG